MITSITGHRINGIKPNESERLIVIVPIQQKITIN